MVLGLSAQNYELSPATYVDSQTTTEGETTTYYWNFESNRQFFTVVCGKAYAEGSGNTKGTLKLSRNHNFTVNIPDGVSVTGIKVKGWSNIDETSADPLATMKINGVDDTNTLPYKTAATPAEFTIDCSSSPLTGSFVLRVNGAQACINVTLLTGEVDPGTEPGDEPGGEVTYNANATYALAIGEAHEAGDVVSVKDAAGEEIATLTFGITGEAAYDAAVKDGHIDGFVAYTKGNGVNGKKDGSAGSQYIIVPKYDGKIDAGVVLNADKAFYVLEDGTPLADYNGITETAKYYGLYSFNVKAGKKYVVTCAGSKLGFYGFNYAYNTEGGSEPEPVVTIAKPTFEVDGVTYESGATVTGLKTGQRVTINAEEGMYIYTNWSGSTGKTKADYYTADRVKGQTSYAASTSTGGQRVLYAVAGDTDDATGNSSDLAYIVFSDVTASEPIFTVIPADVENGIPASVMIDKGCDSDIIRYTIDGSDPTANSPEYTDAIDITSDAIVKAIAFDKNGANPSEVVSQDVVVRLNYVEVEITNAGYATFYNAEYWPVEVLTESETEIDPEPLLTPRSRKEPVYFSQIIARPATVSGTSVVLGREIFAIAPGDAVILSGEPGIYQLPVNPWIVVDPIQDNLLHGFARTQMIRGEEGYRYYKLSEGVHGVGFYAGAENYGPFESEGGKAYLAVPAELQVNCFLFDNATGIKGIESAESSEPVYNLQGIRMGNKLVKGVYVQGGKKFVVK